MYMLSEPQPPTAGGSAPSQLPPPLTILGYITGLRPSQTEGGRTNVLQTTRGRSSFYDLVQMSFMDGPLLTSLVDV